MTHPEQSNETMDDLDGSIFLSEHQMTLAEANRQYYELILFRGAGRDLEPQEVIKRVAELQGIRDRLLGERALSA
jgi:hypothetical protein